MSKALSSSLPVEDAATVRQQALQRLARSPEPLRAELWLRRFEERIDTVFVTARLEPLNLGLVRALLVSRGSGL